MPKRRLPLSDWRKLREKIWKRNFGACTHCCTEVSLKEAHIDHIISGKAGTNSKKNLRTLCRRCHVTRGDFRHRGMIYRAIIDGIIPADWRPLLWWDDGDLLS